MGVLANSLKREFALVAKHQSVWLLIIYVGSSQEKLANKPKWSQAQFLGGEGMDQHGRSLSSPAHLAPAHPWV